MLDNRFAEGEYGENMEGAKARHWRVPGTRYSPTHNQQTRIVDKPQR
jgi:hypothetical protein